MITVLDVETSFQIVDGKVDPLPFNPNNCLVSIGVNDEYYFFRTIFEGEKLNLQLNRYTKKLIIFENDEPDVWGTCELIKKSY